MTAVMDTAEAPSTSPASRPEPPIEDEGFGIYVHWPFCLSKCPYCDFNSRVADDVDAAAWARGYLAALRHFRTLMEAGPVTSVFFGGGTPSLMPPALVAEVLAAIDALWGMSAMAEITLEANPTSVERGRFAAYAEAGVNRLSLGVQALDDDALRALGRTHTAAHAMAAWETAMATFPRASFDLICGRPGQTPGSWEEELSRGLALRPAHLSVYQLTMEPGTPFHTLHQRGRLSLPEEDSALALLEITARRLEAAGLVRYEVSNHARPGEECRHNLLYWRHGAYAGIGPGAHSRLHREENGGALRVTALSARRRPEAWLATAPTGGIEATERLSPGAAATEALLMGLRTREGVPMARIAHRLGGVVDDSFLAAATELEGIGLLAVRETRSGIVMRATAAGLRVLDAMVDRLVPPRWLA